MDKKTKNIFGLNSRDTNKTLIFLVFLIVSILSAASIAKANPYITIDVATGRILAHNQAFDRWYPASLTKLMTAYITFEALRKGEIKKDSRVVLSAKAAKAPPSHSGYKAGSVLDLDTALSITLVKSTNDLAMAIADTVAGSQKAFVAKMNATAKRLGMYGTHFANTNGLPNANNYSTARDIALLAREIRLEFPQYAHYFAIPAIDFGDGSEINGNSNNLIGRFQGADGMKTGFICASGYNLAASATQNNRTIIAVVLGAERIDQREELAAKLLNDGFKTQGSDRLTIKNLKPYGDKTEIATNLYNVICTKQANIIRHNYIDDDGDIIFNSPFIGALKPYSTVMQVRLIPKDQNGPNANIPLNKIPVPIKRPEYGHAQ